MTATFVRTLTKKFPLYAAFCLPAIRELVWFGLTACLQCEVMYSGILGSFPNIMIIQDGASGDGKSPPLWFDTQVCHYFRKKSLELVKAAWDVRVSAHETWASGDKSGPEPPKPGPEPKAKEEMYDGGSTGGLGRQFSQTCLNMTSQTLVCAGDPCVAELICVYN